MDGLGKLIRMATAQRVAATLMIAGLPMTRTNAFAALKEVMRDENVDIDTLDEIADDIIRIAQASERLLGRADIER